MPDETNALPPTSSEGKVAAKNLTKKQLFLMVGLFIVLAGGFLFYNLTNLAQRQLSLLPNSPFTPAPSFRGSFELKKFKSAQEFQNYIQQNQTTTFGMGIDAVGATREVTNTAVLNAAPEAALAPSAVAPDRFSTTNVQVVGIDEPDIVKTNGQQIFLSTDPNWYYPMPVDLPVRMDNVGQSSAGSAGMEIAPAPPTIDITTDAVAPTTPMMRVAPGYPAPVRPTLETQVLTAFPPAALAKLAKIDTAGQLLLSEKTLIVLGSLNGQQVITGFDISQPASPVQKWQMKVEQSNQLVATRLMDNKLYAITQSYFYNQTPCPFVPLTQANGQKLNIQCTDIYYPDHSVSGVDSTFTAMIINPETGALEKTTSVVGSTSNSVIYVSPTSLYLTYQAQADMTTFMYKFVTEKGSDLFSTVMIDKLSRLQNYDLSSQAKMVELQTIMESYQRTLSSDDRLRLENELQNRMNDYLKQHSRELEQTLIVKLNASDLSTVANGGVPGFLLNQFSMDEYQGSLRVATTFGSWTQFGQAESASDVYVLDGNLQQKGVVTDLGVGERIYAVRFLADKGYVVTFKQVDPFYILDLSNPERPLKTGELKIPGYSSYLHPIGMNRVVGIGKENNQIKVSLFDVSDASSPKEVSKYQLDEYWSELLSTHHAFLLDEKHQVFFMPGTKGGYVFSYADDQLKLVKAISQDQVQRALFINDYLYVLSQNKITVLNENDWQEVKELDL